ncbi:amidase [Roseomonas fluvialis]|uniref:Amidase n=1 Tax=Roseomonas fluvialis TaxID=1750527 RepID=A0ABM7Y8E1_9PROT|nr:amidase [Roseomonas fluvialis]BDG74273.1 amidase [Roseomonas fluvialis]
MADARLNEISASETARRIAQGETTARAVVEACLEQVARRETEVMAFEWLDADGARRAADAIDARDTARHLPIAGACFGVKDIIDTADMPTGYGSPIHAGHRPGADAACVALSRKGGGIALGKTVTTEFANVHPGRTRNPHDAQRTPGGSSSGSAAAVAAMMVPLALGTQTTSSTIRPASFCGVIGFVPTQGAVSVSGVRAAAGSLDRIGLFARSVDEIALYLDVLRGIPRAEAPSRRTFAPRIGLCADFLAERMDPGTQDGLLRLARRLDEAGAAVADCAVPADFARLTDEHRWVSSFEFVRNFAYEIENHWERISTTLREGRISHGLACTHDQYRTARALAAAAQARIDEMFGSHDVLLAASAAGEAPVGTATGDFAFCALWTMLGVPAISLPLMAGASGLPVGAQLLARPGDEALLLAAAAWIMAQRDD